MTRNVGTTDRIIRIVLGLIIIGLGVYFGSWWGAVGAILLATGLVGWCAIYAPFGISTCGVKR